MNEKNDNSNSNNNTNQTQINKCNPANVFIQTKHGKEIKPTKLK